MAVSAQTSPNETDQLDSNSIALCLSGGGLRATLFHLGVIRALRQTQFGGKMALLSVKEVYSVSGGSILAAHFLANYQRYINPADKVFRQVERDLIRLADRDLRNRIIRRWPFYAFLGNARGHLLQAEYDRFLGRKTIGQCYPAGTPMPTFHFLATSFTSGALCSFSRAVFEQVDRRGGISTASTAADGLPLAFAVAASSAFPPLFPPIRLTPQALGTDGSPPFNTPIALSDGGVFDNFGIDKFCLSQRTNARPALLIVSNAGGSFATDPEHRYNGMFSRNIRASDILMRRVGETTLDTGGKLVGRGLVLVRIGETVHDPAIAELTQQRFRLIRTDLDRFVPDLAQLIVQHGERVAHEALKDHRLGSGASPTFEFAPLPAEGTRAAATADRTETLDRELSSAARRSWFNLVFDFRDVIFITLWWAIGLAILGGITFLLYSGVSFLEANKKASGAKVAADFARQRAERSLGEALAASDSRAIALAISNAKLEAVRRAAIRDDMNDVRRTLAIAIETNKGLAQQPDSTAPAVAPIRSPAQVDQIIATPVVRLLPPVSYPQKVTIQFAGALAREQITTLNQMLRQAGWQAQGPSGERTPLAAGKGEVRYGGDDLAAAQALADALNQSGLPIRRVVPRADPDIGGNLEVWISR